MGDPNALRFRVCVGTRSPLYAVMAALPAEDRAAALLRLAEAGLDARARGSMPQAQSPAPSDVADLTAAVRRLATAMDVLAVAHGGRTGVAAAPPPPDGAAERAAGLDAAWGG